MAKKIKQRSNLTREEREAERQRKQEEQERQAAGIDDDFQARGFELADWAQNNSHIIMMLIGLIVVAGGVTFGVQYMQEQDGTEASQMFDEAHDAFSASLGDAPSFSGEDEEDALSFSDAKERATESRKLFQKIVETHAGTGAAELAHLYIGHTSVTLEDYAAAAEAYRTFLDSVGKADPLRFLALDGLSIALEAQGDKQAAIQALERQVGLPGDVGQDAALLRLARLYKETGAADKARATAQRLIADHPQSPLKPEAEQLAASIGSAPAGAEADPEG